MMGDIKLFRKKFVIMHQTTYDYLYENMSDLSHYMPSLVLYNQYDFTLSGYPIKIDNSLPRTIRVGEWIFPKNIPFIQYGPEDEYVCRYCKIGKENPELELGKIFIIHNHSKSELIIPIRNENRQRNKARFW